VAGGTAEFVESAFEWKRIHNRIHAGDEILGAMCCCFEAFGCRLNLP
jgi:hypothetical protein